METEITFPLVFNTKNEHINHIKDNREYYLNILFSGEKIEKIENFDTKLEEMTQQLEQENENKLLEELNKKDLFYQERIKNMEELVSLIQLKNQGEASMYKGESFEKKVSITLEESSISSFCTVDSQKMNRMMDIRLLHKFKNNYKIGIECKDKKVITKEDLTKFKRDKLENSFNYGVFVSTSKIPHILENENEYKIVDNEIYIYSKEENFIKLIPCIINCIISTINDEEEEEEEEEEGYNKEERIKELIDRIINIYNGWRKVQKQNLEYDKIIVDTIRNISESELKGHLYIASKSNLKGGKTVY